MNVLSDTALRQRLRQGALRTVSEDYTLERMVQGMLDLGQLADGQRRLVRPLNTAHNEPVEAQP